MTGAVPGVAPSNPHLGHPLDAVWALSCVYSPADVAVTLTICKEACHERHTMFSHKSKARQDSTM